jgi:hypothetical protein
MTTASNEAATRILWPQEDFAQLFDEFAVRGCRVHFRGGWVTIEALSADADTAAVLNDYVAALKKHFGWIHLLTVEAFTALPPRHIQIGAPGWIWKDRCKRLGEARGAIVAPAHPQLSQCYDYFQKAVAVEDPENALSHLYKMIETVEGHYGGERQAQEALGPEPMTTLKRMANDSSLSSRDVLRHSLAAPGTGTPLTAAELSQAIEDGRAILRKFEAAVFSPVARSEPEND